MSIFGSTPAATTVNERRRLHWELLACEQVRGVFSTARAVALAVLFRTTATTNDEGAL